MAGFLDAVPVFNPYVQQLPVEAMVQVGMAKQKAYEENVTKIQGEIDRVAGLDIIRGVDKEYLQSKMNALGNKLNLLAGGDFSNFQLANSVGGMTKQVANDKFVQNAVSSTAKYRKEVARADALKKEGKWSVNRQFDFDNEVNSWLNNTKLETTFNGEFKEHRDVNKKVLEVIAKLHPNVNVQDFPYVMNKDGSIDYKTYASIMQKRGIKAVDEGQIKTAVNAVLDSDDYDELYSQGRYNYRGYTVDNLKESALSSYKNSKKSYEEKLNYLKRQKQMTNDLKQQEEINSSISDYENLLGDGKTPGALDVEFASVLESIQKNPDGARAKLYTRNWLDQIANGFAYREVTDEVLANPGRADDWKGWEFAFQKTKEAHEQYWKNLNYRIDLRKLQIEESKEQRELRKEQRESQGNVPYFTGSGDETTDQLESMKNFANRVGNLTTENDGILSDIAAKRSSLNTQVKPSDVVLKIEEYKQGKYTPSTPYEKEKFDKYIQNANFIKQQTDLVNHYQDKAYEKITGSKSEADAIAKELGARGDLVIDGKRYSGREVFNFLSKESTYFQPSQKEGLELRRGLPRYTIDDSNLTPREREIKRVFAKRYVTPGGGTGNATIDRYISNFDKVTSKYRGVKDEVNKQVAKDMAGVTGIFKTEQAAVVFKDDNEKQRLIDNLTNLAGADINIKVAGQNYSPADLIESMKTKNEKDIAIQLKRQGNEYFIQVVDKKDPGNVQRMPVSEKFVAENASLGQNYLNKGTDLALSLLANNESTNIFDDYNHAHYHNGFFGRYDQNGNRTVTLPIAADLKLEGGSLYPTFRLKTSNGKTLDLPYRSATGGIDYATFQSVYLPSLTNDKIIQLFKTKYPNIEQLIAR